MHLRVIVCRCNMCVCYSVTDLIGSDQPDQLWTLALCTAHLCYQFQFRTKKNWQYYLAKCMLLMFLQSYHCFFVFRDLCTFICKHATIFNLAFFCYYLTKNDLKKTDYIFEQMQYDCHLMRYFITSVSVMICFIFCPHLLPLIHELK